MGRIRRIPILAATVALVGIGLAGCGDANGTSGSSDAEGDDAGPATVETTDRRDGAEYQVVRVPVEHGHFVTCVKSEHVISSGGAGGLSCDWESYRADVQSDNDSTTEKEN